MADEKKTAETRQKATRAAAVETEQRVAQASGAKALSQAEIDAARKEGAKQDIVETSKDQHRALTDGNLASEATGPQYHGMDDIMRFEPLLDLGADALAERIDEKADQPVPEEKVAGLLSLERAGRNRTDHVRVLMDRLGVDSPYEVTNAGPDHTIDTTPVTRLKRG